MDFYAAASQVIPVLFLAMIFENRVLLRGPDSYEPGNQDPAVWNAPQIVIRYYVTLLMAIGELAALNGLYENEVHPLTNALVWLALLSGVGALATAVLGVQWGFWRLWWRSEGRAGWWLSALTLAVAIALTGQFISWFW